MLPLGREVFPACLSETNSSRLAEPVSCTFGTLLPNHLLRFLVVQLVSVCLLSPSSPLLIPEVLMCSPRGPQIHG